MKNIAPSTNEPSDDILSTPCIKVSVEAKYLDAQSEPEENRYVFSYTVKIANKGQIAAQLLRRHWIITDAHGETMEVKGSGVVGQQPWIAPGEEYEYTSGTVLNEFMGCMHGSYEMSDDEGNLFKVDIPVFSLVQPDKLH